MIQITPEVLFQGARYFNFTSLVNAPNGFYPNVPTSEYPGMVEYTPDTTRGVSSDSNTLEIGTKTFSYYGAPTLVAGNLVRIESYSSVVGYMLGRVTSFYSSVGVSHAVVDVYEVHGSGTSLQWYITLQLNRGYNVEQNPNTPHLAKLKVADYYNREATAAFNVPYDITTNAVITSDTPTHQAGYTTTYWGWSTYITEDYGDLHEPWLGTTVTVRIKIKKETVTYIGSGEFTTVTEYSFRDYNHTFTLSDFDPYSGGFTPGQTLPDNPTPSRCENYSDGPIDNFVSTYDQTFNGTTGELLTSVTVTYTFDVQSYVVDVQPGSFFEPPTP
jgi:hypothetical protein